MYFRVYPIKYGRGSVVLDFDVVITSAPCGCMQFILHTSFSHFAGTGEIL